MHLLRPLLPSTTRALASQIAALVASSSLAVTPCRLAASANSRTFNLFLRTAFSSATCALPDRSRDYSIRTPKALGTTSDDAEAHYLVHETYHRRSQKLLQGKALPYAPTATRAFPAGPNPEISYKPCSMYTDLTSQLEEGRQISLILQRRSAICNRFDSRLLFSCPIKSVSGTDSGIQA